MIRLLCLIWLIYLASYVHTDSFVDGAKKRKTNDNTIEISFEDNSTDKDNTSVNSMEGVFEYLPIHTMTAEERARQRVDKRKHQSSLSAAVKEMEAAKQNSHVQIDQKKDILCEGESLLWDAWFVLIY